MSDTTRDDSESLLLTIFDHGIIGFAKASLSGDLIRVNDRFCAITGRSREALVGRPLPDIAIAEDWPSARELLDQLLAGAPPAHDRAAVST